MKKVTTFVAILLAVCFSVSFAASQAAMEKSPGQFNPAEYLQQMKAKYDLLVAESVTLSQDAIITIHVSDRELLEMDEAECETCAKEAQRMKVGKAMETGVDVSFSGANMGASFGMVRSNANGYVWQAAAESRNAYGLRFHFTNFSLPEGAELYVYNMNGEAFGPYVGQGPNGTGDFWANTLSGQVGYVQLRIAGAVTAETLQATQFSIQHVGHMGPNFKLPFLQKAKDGSEDLSITESFCSFNEPCVEDAECYGTGDWGFIDQARMAVAHMQYVQLPWLYYCSGGMVADTDPSTQIPYFLTANHCINTSSAASSLECYFQFWTSSCGGACYDPVGVVPRTVGSTIVQMNDVSDYTLLQLSENPPAGTVFLGWTSTAVAYNNGLALYRISHPGGAPQAFSKQQVDTSKVTCSGWPRGEWIYSQDLIGATEGGSSGSPVLNASGQIVGQLSGACGYNVNDPCDSVSNGTVDGAFANYYNEVKPYLDPAPMGTEMHVDSIVLTFKAKGKSSTCTATVTILDENGSPVSGATVSGTFSGDISGTGSATTDSNGVAVIAITQKVTVSTYTFCVTNVTHASLSYDSSANVETCDTY
jgi:hypothetical protein